MSLEQPARHADASLRVAAGENTATEQNSRALAWTALVRYIRDNDRSNALSFWLAIALIVCLAALPLLSSTSFSLGRYGLAIAYVMAAIGLNIAFGFAGEMVLAQAAIMAVSAYASGILSAKLGWNFATAFPGGVIVGILIGMVMLSPGLRVKGWYLALLTMFSVIVLPRVAILLESWTGGENGLTGIRPAEIFGYRLSGPLLFEVLVLAFVVVWFGAANLLRSGWGQRFRALRDIPRAAQSAGIDLVRTRMAAYFLSSIPPALAGALLAYIEQFVNAESFGFGLLLLILTGVVLGGPGYLWGPVVGMAPLIALSFFVGPFSPFNAIALGLGLLAGSLIFVDGLVPAIASRAARRKRSIPQTDPRSDQDIPAATTVTVSGIRVHASAISQNFGGVLALDGVDLDIRPGALIGLVGPNGSGKSTFLNVLCGFCNPDRGQIELNAHNVTGWPVHRIAGIGVGRTFQVPQLIDELPVIDNIEVAQLTRRPDSIFAALLSLPSVARHKKERRAAAFEAFLATGLPAELIATPAGALPLGLKRIVEVGRALASSPGLLLLDEPAAGLNAQEREQLGVLLRQLNKKGITILVVEHNVPFVLRHCEEVVLLEAGKVACRAPLNQPLPDRLLSYIRYAPATAED